MTAITKQYVDTPRGQVHVRRIAAVDDHKHPLLCLHPAPSSGLYFDTVMPMINNTRDVIAPDYPGHGGSYALEQQPDIDDYATSMLSALDALQIDSAVDVLGFHTGCLVGAEMALNNPERINTLILCDVPFYEPDTQAELIKNAAKPMTLSTDIDSIAATWKMNVPARFGKMPDTRVLSFLAEQLRCLGRDHFAFNAAFRYPCLERLSALRANTIVLATQSVLLEPSRVAAEVIPDATLVEALDISDAVFELGAARISEEILRILDNA